MSLSSPFIHRPVATTLLTAAIALAGMIAFLMLPVSPLPQVDFPTISVGAALPGASPEIMASSVATPLERQFGRIASVTEMTSTSTLGATSITLQFALDRNIDGAARDVQAAINAASAYLPPNLPQNPTWRKVNPSDAPIMILALTSDIYGKGRLYDAASTILMQRLSQIDGVGQVVVGGGALPSVRIEINPTQLNGYGLSLLDVANVVSAQNVNAPKGQISDDETTADITVNDQLLEAKDYQPLIVGYQNGAAVKLSDFASVVDSVQDVRQAGYANGKPSILLVIFKQPQANVIDAVDRIKEALPSLKASIPKAIDISIMMDRTTTIRASVRDVEITLAISVALVILVVFLFLRNVRATMIPGIAVPVSLIGTFGVMYLCHYSLDNLSLMAMTISTGFVVDDAIVVIENITRHLEQGMLPMEAALRGAREIGFTVVSISLSLVTVFTPILLMGGIVGRLFREFAVTLSVAIIVSLGVSLTTTPMMCSRLLKEHRKEHEGKFYRATGRVLAWMLRVYEHSLSWVLRHPAITLTTLIVTVALNGFLFWTIPKGFFPQQDTGIVFGRVLAVQDTSFQAMEKRMLQIVKIVKADPAVDNVAAFMGGTTGSDTGFLYMSLKPRNQRDATADQVIARLRRPASKVAGATMYLQASQDLRIGGRSSPAQYQYTVWCDNLQDLNTWGPIMLAKVKKLHGLTDVNSDQRNNGLLAHLDYDRPSAMRMGLTPRTLDSTLYAAFGQDEVSTMYTALNQYYVVMEVAPEYWQTPQGLNYVYLPAANSSGQVPLSAVADFTAGTAPIAVNHQGQFPSVTLSFNLAPGVAVGDAVEEINQMQREVGLPASIRGTFSGTLQAFTASLSTEPWLIAIALVAVYIVLGVLYESYIHPITIISTLPSAGLGAVLALMFCHTDLSIIALIGVILLIGIVKKNAILMIDFALDAERREGKSSRDAIYQACLLRFRPILMTTMAAMLGAMPLVVGLGIGSELRRPLGIAIVGGLAVSQVLTLYTTPVVYLYLDRLAVWWRQLHGKPVGEAVREAGVNP